MTDDFLSMTKSKISFIKKYISRFFKKRSAYPEKKFNLHYAIGFAVANNIEGDYLEFGVFKGESFIYAYKHYNKMFANYRKTQKVHSRFLDHKIRFFAFDSFEGLPDSDDKDIPLHWTGEKPMSYPRFKFEKNLKKANVDLNKVSIIEGYYDKTLTKSLYAKLGLEKAAIIHIDCDLYESTKTVLDTIKPLIVEGTVIIFDDYFYYKGSPYKGERGAFNEWLVKNPDFIATEICKYYPAAVFALNKREDKPVIF